MVNQWFEIARAALVLTARGWVREDRVRHGRCIVCDGMGTVVQTFVSGRRSCHLGRTLCPLCTSKGGSSGIAEKRRRDRFTWEEEDVEVLGEECGRKKV